MMTWIDAIKNKPIAYKTGDWDGRNSDLVVAKDLNGSIYLAYYSEGVFRWKQF